MSPCQTCHHAKRDKNVCIDSGCTLPADYSRGVHDQGMVAVSVPAAIPVARVDQWMKPATVPERRINTYSKKQERDKKARDQKLA